MTYGEDSRPCFYFLKCPVRNYTWGNRSGDGIIADLIQKNGKSELLNEPLAEFWMGAHPSDPSLILPDSTRLDQAIKSDPSHFLGPELSSRGLVTLPFLFKIIDVVSPLSIQAHPDIRWAKILHAKDPVNYPDSNHKPELAISLGESELLIGFRPIAEIIRFLKILPELMGICCDENELSELIPESVTEENSKILIKKWFSGLMLSSAQKIEKITYMIQKRKGLPDNQETEISLFNKLLDIFGKSDPGIFSPFFLNYLILSSGDAVYLGPAEPHAYLKGTFLEGMASSDNVVRAGLTGKFRDVDTLLQMLHYEGSNATIISPELSNESDASIETYRTPAREFLINRLPGGKEKIYLQNHNRPSIILILKGEIEITFSGSKTTQKGKKGNVIFFPGDLAMRGLMPGIKGSADILVYQITIHPEYLK